MNIKYIRASGSPSTIVYSIDLIERGHIVQPIFIYKSKYDDQDFDDSLEYIKELKKTFKDKLLDLKVLDYRNKEIKDNRKLFLDLSQTKEYQELKSKYGDLFLPTIERCSKEITHFNLIFDYVENDMPSDVEGIVFNCLKSANVNQNFTIKQNGIIDYTKIYEEKINLDLPFFDIFKKIILSGDSIPIENIFLDYKDDVNVLNALQISSFCYNSRNCGRCDGCTFKKSLKINSIIILKNLDKMLKRN